MHSLRIGFRRMAAAALVLAIGACETDPAKPFVPPPVLPVDTEPTWSPDGQSVLYTHAAQSPAEAALGASQIWRLDLASGVREYLTAGKSATCSPDGGSIALIDGYRLVVMDLATKTKRPIGPNAPSFRPAWSPDGRWIAYDANYGDPVGFSAIFLIHPDGTEFTDISEHNSSQWNQPRWSPDNQWLVHRRYVGAGDPELFVMDTTGAQPLRLTHDAADDRDPAWSPDGQWIVWRFLSAQADEAGLWLMRPDGRDRSLLIAGGFEPAWAPDGTRIAFSYSPSPDSAATLWSIAPDGSNLTRLIVPE